MEDNAEKIKLAKSYSNITEIDNFIFTTGWGAICMLTAQTLLHLFYKYVLVIMMEIQRISIANFSTEEFTKAEYHMSISSTANVIYTITTIGIVISLVCIVSINELRTEFLKSPVIKTDDKKDYVEDTNSYLSSSFLQYLTILFLIFFIFLSFYFKEVKLNILSIGSLIAGIGFLLTAENKRQNILEKYYTEDYLKFKLGEVEYNNLS